MKRLYKNWFVHNMFAHPLSEIAYWCVRLGGKPLAYKVSAFVHDATIPEMALTKAEGG
jgi:hypothetical protein